MRLQRRINSLKISNDLHAADAKAAHALVDDLKRDRDEALQGLADLAKERDYLRTDRDYFFTRQQAAVAALDHAADELIRKDDEIERLKAVGKRESERILHHQRESKRLQGVIARLGFEITRLKASQDWHKKTREEAITANQAVKAELAQLHGRIKALTQPEMKFVFTNNYNI